MIRRQIDGEVLKVCIKTEVLPQDFNFWIFPFLYLMTNNSSGNLEGIEK